MWPSVAVCLEALEMKTRVEVLQNQSRGATCQNPTEVLQIKIHTFFSPLRLKPRATNDRGRFWPCVFEFAPKPRRNSFLFAPKACQNHVWPFVFHFLNSPLPVQLLIFKFLS